MLVGWLSYFQSKSSKQTGIPRFLCCKLLRALFRSEDSELCLYEAVKVSEASKPRHLKNALMESKHDSEGATGEAGDPGDPGDPGNSQLNIVKLWIFYWGPVYFP